MADYAPTLIPLPATATPESYRSAEAIKAQRDYANALLYGKGQQPVQHWSQGVSNMVSALMGGQAAYAATQRENASNDITSDSMTVPLTGGAAPKSFSDAQSSEGGTSTDDTGDMAARKAAVSTIESGSPEGNYHAIGPLVTKGAYAGDKAYGKYQVMGKNLTKWSQEIFGRVMTPAEFMDNPKAQEKMFEIKSTSNPRDWFGHGFSDGKTTGTEYERRYAEGLSKYRGGGTQPAQTATAFAGAPAEAPAEAPGPAAITAAALRGGSAGPGMRQQAMPVGGQAPLIDPATVPRPPKIPYEQMRAIMRDPRIPWEQKMQMQTLYFQQQQPITVPVPGGSVVVSPDDPRIQRANPEVHWERREYPGGYHKDVPSTVGSGSNGGIIQTPAIKAPVGPRSDAGGAVTPSAAPEGGLGPTPASVQAGAQSVPLPTPRPPGANAADAAPDPVQVASLDPTAGVAKAGEAPSAEAAPVVPVSDETKVAQAPLADTFGPNSKAPAGVDKEDWDIIQGFKKSEMDAAIAQEKAKAAIGVAADSEKESNKMSAERYKDVVARTEAATDLRKTVSTARAMVEEKNFSAGLGAGLKENWKQFQAALGIDPNAPAPMEIFRKTSANQVMTGLKTAFGGWAGQLRVMEIELQKTANASINNSVPAIRALLEITDRNAALVQDVGEMTMAYKAGQAVMDPKDPTKVLIPANIGPDGEPMERNRLDAKFDRVMQRYAKEHPTFTKDEYANFNEILKAPGDKATGKAEALPIEIPDTALKHLKVGKEQRFENGQVYTLGADGKPKRVK